MSQQPTKKKIDLSLPQVLGGSLAAATVAALGSRLGLSGTIAGAALFSVVAAVSTALYRSGIEHTHERVRTWVGRPVASDESETVAVAGMADPTGSAPAPTVIGSEPIESPARTAGTRPRAGSRRPVLTGALLGGLISSVATFVLALAFITGAELTTGKSLDGSSGTSVANAVQRKPSPTPTVTVTATPSVPTVTAPAVTVTPTVTAPAATASPTASDIATPSVAPTAATTGALSR